MKSTDNAVRAKIASNRFTRKELRMFKQKLQADDSFRKVNKSDLHNIIHTSAKRAFRDVVLAFFAMLFLQIPFITSAIIARNLDLLFISVAFVFLIYVIIYITAGIRKIPVCTQFKLVKLAISIIFTTYL